VLHLIVTRATILQQSGDGDPGRENDGKRMEAKEYCLRNSILLPPFLPESAGLQASLSSRTA
jgi:hypothetical protein